MTVEEAIKRCPDLLKITINDITHVTSGYFNTDIDFSISWGKNGFDELDCVELVMHLEKNLKIAIPDDVCACFFEMDSLPIAFKQVWRERSLKKLLPDE